MMARYAAQATDATRQMTNSSSALPTTPAVRHSIRSQLPSEIVSIAESILSTYYPSAAISNIATLSPPSTVVIDSQTYRLHGRPTRTESSKTPSTTGTTRRPHESRSAQDSGTYLHTSTPSTMTVVTSPVHSSSSTTPTTLSTTKSPATSAEASSTASSGLPTPSTTTADSSSSNDDDGKIPGIILGVLLSAVAIILMLVLFFCLWRRKRKTGKFLLDRNQPRRRRGTRGRRPSVSTDSTSARNSLVQWIPPGEMAMPPASAAVVGGRFPGLSSMGDDDDGLEAGMAVGRPVRPQPGPPLRGGGEGSGGYERLHGGRRLGVLEEAEEEEAEQIDQRLQEGGEPEQPRSNTSSGSMQSDGRFEVVRQGRADAVVSHSPATPFETGSAWWSHYPHSSESGASPKHPSSRQLLPSVAMTRQEDNRTPHHHNKGAPLKRYHRGPREGNPSRNSFIVPRRPVVPSRSPARDTAPLVHYPSWEEINEFDFSGGEGQSRR